MKRKTGANSTDSLSLSKRSSMRTTWPVPPKAVLRKIAVRNANAPLSARQQAKETESTMRIRRTTRRNPFRGGMRAAYHIQPCAGVSYTALPAATAEAQAHWKLNPPRWPVTSTTSPPLKNRPGMSRTFHGAGAWRWGGVDAPTGNG